MIVIFSFGLYVNLGMNFSEPADITKINKKNYDEELSPIVKKNGPLDFIRVGIINEKVKSERNLSWVVEDFETKEKFMIVSDINENSLQHFFVGQLINVHGYKTGETMNGLPVVQLDDMEFAFRSGDSHKSNPEEVQESIKGVKIIKQDLPHYLEFEILGNKNILKSEQIALSFYVKPRNGEEKSFLPKTIIGGYNWYEDRFVVKVSGLEKGKLKLGISTGFNKEDLIFININ